MRSIFARASQLPGPVKVSNDAPVVLALRIHSEVRPVLEAAAAEAGFRVLFARHLNAACAALTTHPVAVVLADESVRPWDREVLQEHASVHGIDVVWVEAELAHDFIADVLRTCISSRKAPKSSRPPTLAM